VIDVAVGVDDGLDGRLRVVRAQSGDDCRGEPLLSGVHDQDAPLADKGSRVPERREEGDPLGHELRLAEMKEGGLLWRKAAGGAEVEALGLELLGHRGPSFGGLACFGGMSTV